LNQTTQAYGPPLHDDNSHNVTLTVAAGQILTVQSDGATFDFENPVGTRVGEYASDSVFGPFAATGSVKIASVQGALYYELGRVSFTRPDDIAAGDDGKYKMVGGVIRNYNDGSGWRLITPAYAAGHNPLNIDSVTSDATSIYINYPGIAATGLVSFVAVPDETLQAAGFFMGSSVTTSQAVISLSRYSEIADYVSYSGSAWTSLQGMFSNFSYSAGVLTMSHDSVQTTDRGIVASVTARSDTYDAGADSMSATTTNIKFYARSGGALATVADTNMKAFVSRGEKLYAVDPSTVNTTTYPGGNIWFLGLFKVN
jgi:hypothetical protein